MESSEPVSDPGCPNCGRFCPSCGQEQGELVPSIASWARDAAADLFEVDGKGVWPSLKYILHVVVAVSSSSGRECL